MKSSLINRLKDVFAELTGKNRFDRVDFVILKTMLMLAAVDGEVGDDEVGRFSELAAKCRGYSGEPFEMLWDAALRSAGYLLLQTRFLNCDELVAAFVKEAEKDFVGEIVIALAADRERAFDRLERMASADGDYSDIERACITALSQKVKVAREKMLDERYPRAAKFDRRSAPRT